MSGLDDTAVLLGVLVSGLSLLSGIGGAIAWVRSSTRKQYAAERDFNHLKRSYEALTINVEQLWREVEEKNGEQLRKLDRLEVLLTTQKE